MCPGHLCCHRCSRDMNFETETETRWKFRDRDFIKISKTESRDLKSKANTRDMKIGEFCQKFPEIFLEMSSPFRHWNDFELLVFFFPAFVVFDTGDKISLNYRSLPRQDLKRFRPRRDLKRLRPRLAKWVSRSRVSMSLSGVCSLPDSRNHRASALDPEQSYFVACYRANWSVIQSSVAIFGSWIPFDIFLCENSLFDFAKCFPMHCSPNVLEFVFVISTWFLCFLIWLIGAERRPTWMTSLMFLVIQSLFPPVGVCNVPWCAGWESVVPLLLVFFH